MGMGQKQSFVPGPVGKRVAPVVAATTAGAMGAPAAFADEIGDAAKKLGEASYAFAKEVDWNNGLYLQAPGQFQPLKALTAIDKMIVLGAQADPKLLSAAAAAHHKAIGSISGPNGVTSKADWEAVNAALGRVFASVPEASVMDVYNAVSDITDPGAPAYLKSLVNGADAEKAYAAFLEFKGVTSAADYAAVNAALGKVIASVPTGQVMDVYNAFAKIVPGQVPNMLFNSVNPLDANAAAKAFYTFKDVVKAAQR